MYCGLPRSSSALTSNPAAAAHSPKPLRRKRQCHSCLPPDAGQDGSSTEADAAASSQDTPPAILLPLFAQEFPTEIFKLLDGHSSAPMKTTTVSTQYAHVGGYRLPVGFIVVI